MNAATPIALMLRHEVRLNWRQSSARMTPKVTAAVLIGALVFMHLVALPFPFVLSEMPALARADVLAALTGAGVFLLVMMVPVALTNTVQLIYERADMDLLLSSPVEPKAVILVRVLTTAWNLFCIAGLLTLPFANVLAVFGYPRFLIAYPALACLALASTVIGVLLAQGLFWLFGPRRTRLLAQILAGLMGAAFVLLMNIHNLLPSSVKGAALESWAGLIALLPNVESVVWLPARAALGEPLPLVAAIALCAGLFVLTTFGLAHRLIANAIAANGSAANSMRSSRALMPGGGAISIMQRKELLLIRRDPWLISQIGMQLVLWLPSIFVAWKIGASGASLWGLALVFLAGNLAGMLAWLTISTEEAPDLLATAPVRRRDVVWAKLQAALVPTAVLAALPIAVLFYLDVWLGFTVLLCATGSALSTSLLHVRNPAQAKRKELSWRGGSSRMVAVVEMLLGTMWVGFGALMLAFGWWGMLSLLILLPFVARMRR
jgi:ABC-2 type transport system permease protein